MMDYSRRQLSEGLWADCRRALWLEPERALVIADLHLGYAWAQRARGQLLPLADYGDAAARLAELRALYQPRRLVLLGDVVHRALPFPALMAELAGLLESWLSAGVRVELVLGNHDADLERLLAAHNNLLVVSCLQLGPHVLAHGDQPVNTPTRQGGKVIIGHEHPAITIHDGVANGVKCPCFLVGPRVLVLPAFSSWAAGTVLGRSPFLSPLARNAQFTQAVAVMGDKLLPVMMEGAKG